jgi:hypothetical protein
MKELNQTEGAVVSHDEFETAPLPNVGRKGEAGYSVGQPASGLLTAPTIAAAVAPTSGRRSMPEIGGESDFGMNAKPENSSNPVEYVARPSNLPDTIALSQIADAGKAFVDGRDGNVGWGAK